MKHDEQTLREMDRLRRALEQRLGGTRKPAERQRPDPWAAVEAAAKEALARITNR